MRGWCKVVCIQYSWGGVNRGKYLLGGSNQLDTYAAGPYVRRAISKVLPVVPRMRLSCIFFTILPVRRSVDKGHSMR
jgi:hypothetical protein